MMKDVPQFLLFHSACDDEWGQMVVLNINCGVRSVQASAGPRVQYGVMTSETRSCEALLGSVSRLPTGSVRQSKWIGIIHTVRNSFGFRMENAFNFRALCVLRTVQQSCSATVVRYDDY